ncbi:MAG: tetratricopeptide repeat protein, partial [Bacteroidota bacterium]
MQRSIHWCGIFLFSLLLISQIHCIATNSDSIAENLKKEVRNALRTKNSQVNIPEKIDSLIHLYYYSNPDSAIKYCDLNLTIYKYNNNVEKVIENLALLTEIYLYQKKDDLLAMQSCLEAYKYKETSSNSTPIINPYLYIDLGNTCLQYSLFEKSIYFYSLALAELDNPKKDAYTASVALNNMAITFRLQKNFDKSWQYFSKALQIRKTLHPLYVAHNYAQMNELLFDWGKYDLVVEYYNKIKKLTQNKCITDNSSGIFADGENSAKLLKLEIEARNYQLLARYFSVKKVNDSSIFYINKAIEKWTILNSAKRIRLCNILKAEFYYAALDFSEAELIAKQISVESKKLKDWDAEKQALTILLDIGKTQRNTLKENSI